jgi:hypothetical protein
LPEQEGEAIFYDLLAGVRGPLIKLSNNFEGEKTMIKLRKSSLYYFLYSHAPGRDEYSHPTITVYAIDPQYPTCHDQLFQITSQCDRDKGFNIRKSYSLYLDMNLATYHTDEAFTLLKKIGFGTDNRPVGMVGTVRALRKAKITRYSVETTHITESGYENKEMIPRKFRKQAALYWEALKNGLTLKKAA